MLFIYRIKWFFHCLFKMHRQMTVTTYDSVLIGCSDCNILNDKEGVEYKLTNT